MNSPPVPASTLLIIDDTPANLGVVTTYLEEHGFRVAVAQDGEEGLARARFVRPDLILLDVMMPDMDGFETCRRLKADENTRDIPVIFMTALADTADKLAGFAAGGVDYVIKPFEIAEVVARIDTHLALRALQQQLAAQNLQLRQARAAAEAASRAKGEFLANMSHELRSPLNTILGFARLAAGEAALPARTRADFGLIIKSGEHLHALIDEVLDLAKLEAGRATANESDFDLDFLLDELRDMFLPLAADKNLQLNFACAPDAPRRIRSDLLKLRQVLINLVGNALKFTRAGGIEIRVGAGAAAEGGRQLEFAVADSGIGIDADELGQLFAPFVQARAGRRMREGSGLGLAISRGYVELLGGRMRIDSEPGRGTTVGFSLPVEEAAGPPAPGGAPRRRVLALAPGQRRYRLLVADDRPEARQLLVRLFAPLGFELREAGDGLAAVDLALAWRPDLVWMDMRMPGLDGREATRRIRAAHLQPPPVVVALTASVFEEERAEVLAAGCDDFQRKPFHEADLFALLEKHLGVRFVYDEAPPDSPPPLSPQALAALPAALRASLAEALSHLDMAAVERAIAAIREGNPRLADTLALWAGDFRYEQILSLLSGGHLRGHRHD